MICESCTAENLDIDVKCGSCGAPLTSTGAHRMVGQVVLEQYEIVDVLGQGGMAVVYKGRHRLTHQEVALKILPPELAAHSQVKSRFLEEARALAQLDHPNIVHLYNFGQENGCFVLAMQFVVGQTFERAILEAGQLDWPTAVRVNVDVLRALEYAHGRGVIHRDMKPSNILVRADDGSATVMDFGIAKMTTSSKLTATGQTMGTVRYMSPEQVRGRPVDVRTDIYSVGIGLFEALVGDTPFDGETHFEIMTKHLSAQPKPPSSYGVDIPAPLEAIVMRAIAKRLDDRFDDARAFRKALEEVLEGADVGQASTLRMSRKLVAPRPRATAEDRAAPEVTGLASSLEPTTDLPLGGGPAPAAASEVATRGRPWLWIGLAGTVVVAAAAVVFGLLRGGAEATAVAESPAPDAPAAEPVRWPAAFVPADVRFAVDETFADDELRVAAVTALDPEMVRQARAAGHDRFAGLLVDLGLAEVVERQPLSILVVPRRVLCDPRIYDSPELAAGCRERESFYRPVERTLLVLDDQAHLAANSAYGTALAVCLHARIAGCEDALAEFDAELEP